MTAIYSSQKPNMNTLHVMGSLFSLSTIQLLKDTEDTGQAQKIHVKIMVYRNSHN